MKLLVIIPAYNEADSIVEVIKNIPQNIRRIDQINILVIDDGSTDKTVFKVKSETKATVISHQGNRGVGVAFGTGISYALENRADLVVNIDADGQFNPLDIPQLVQPILNNQADFVTASRFIKKDFIPQMPRIKLWGNRRVASLISWLTREKFYDVSCGFRAYNKEAILSLNLFGQFTYTQEVFLDLSFKGLRIKEIPIKVRYFPQRRSRVYQGIFHYGFNTLKIILKTLRDYRPFRFFGSIGLIIFFIGLILDIFMMAFYLKTGGFTPYKVVGLTGLSLNVIGLGVLFLALIADMLYRLRINQEKLLYYEKKRRYYS
ncbi:MAG: hypothetical protein A3H00_01790 [Candidatus Portnoybacteria bacterium RBG_13_40_8]|nr:MAG: hypothetical protein A3H00_01790 [Candidatus Portnoybacteria bacterium RBG_13_40_8]